MSPHTSKKTLDGQFTKTETRWSYDKSREESTERQVGLTRSREACWLLAARRSNCRGTAVRHGVVQRTAQLYWYSTLDVRRKGANAQQRRGRGRRKGEAWAGHTNKNTHTKPTHTNANTHAWKNKLYLILRYDMT
jgi:hypothetical protein